MPIKKGKIGNALESVAPDHTVAVAADIYDETLNKYQSELNQQIGQGGYNPPQGGIPKSDLSSSVQASLDKADAAVPNTRTVNGKALSSNITLNASDVNALPSSTTIPTTLSQMSDDATHRTVTDSEKTSWNDKYTKQEVNALVAGAPEANVVVIDNPSGADPTTLLPSTPAAKTIYRVKSADGTYFSEYEHDGTKYVNLADRQYGIDNKPTVNSEYFPSSGGTFDLIFNNKILIEQNGIIEIPLGTWENGGWDANGEPNLNSYNFVFRQIVDVSDYAGMKIVVKSYVYDYIYCCFKDEDGVLISSFQTARNELTAYKCVMVPSNATNLYLSGLYYNEEHEEGIKREDVKVYVLNENALDAYRIGNTFESLIEKECAVTYTDGKWIDNRSGYEFLYKNEASVSIVTLNDSSLKEGDVYLVRLSQNLDIDNEFVPGYFVFEMYGNIAAVLTYACKKYIKKLSYGSDWSLWEVAIPSGCTRFHTLTALNKKSGLKIYKANRKKLPWVEFNLNNLTANNLRSFRETFTYPPYLEDVIKKPIDFKGKRVVAFGDSITDGYTSGSTRTENSYIKLLCDYAGVASLDNRASAGTTIIHTENRSIVDKVLAYTGIANIIWIAGGTNDYHNRMTIGHWGDNGQSTIYGAMKQMCEHLNTNCPNAKVIWLTPIPYKDENTWNSDYGISDNRHNILDDYTKAIFEVATYYGHSVICGKRLGMQNTANEWADIMSPDGCHPSEYGHKLMAASLSSKLLGGGSTVESTMNDEAIVGILDGTCYREQKEYAIAPNLNSYEVDLDRVYINFMYGETVVGKDFPSRVVTKIKFKSLGQGTTSFWVCRFVYDQTNPVVTPVREICSVENSASELNTIKEVDCQVYLNPGEAIGIHGSMYYGRASDGTMINTTGEFTANFQIAYGLEYSEYTEALESIENAVFANTSKQFEVLKSLNIHENVGNIYINFRDNHTVAGGIGKKVIVKKLLFKAMQGTIQFYACKFIYDGSNSVVRPVREVASFTNTSAEEGSIKEEAVNIELYEGEAIGVKGALYYGNAGTSGYSIINTEDSQHRTYSANYQIAYGLEYIQEDEKTKVEIEDKESNASRKYAVLQSDPMTKINSNWVVNGTWNWTSDGVTPSSAGTATYIRNTMPYWADKRFMRCNIGMHTDSKLIIPVTWTTINDGEGASCFAVDFNTKKLIIYAVGNGRDDQYYNTGYTSNILESVDIPDEMIREDLFTVEIHKDSANSLIRLTDNLTGISVEVSHNGWGAGRQNQCYCFCTESGTPVTISNFKVYSLNRPDVVFIGDSITEGVAVMDKTKRYAELFRTNNPDKKVVISARGSATINDLLAMFVSEYNIYRPRYISVLIGANGGSNEGNLLRLVNCCKSIGCKLILNKRTCQSSSDAHISGNELIELMDIRGARFDLATALDNYPFVDAQHPAPRYNPSLYYDSGVHPNNDGDIQMYKRLLIDVSELFYD